MGTIALKPLRNKALAWGIGACGLIKYQPSLAVFMSSVFLTGTVFLRSSHRSSARGELQINLD